MKKIIFLLIAAFALNACSSDDSSSPNVTYELLPIMYCQMPYRYVSGQTYDLQMYFRKPTSCHFYKGIYFEKQGNTRIVAIQSGVVESNSCETYDYNQTVPPETSKETFKFTFTGQETYTFKLWTGKNEQGEDTYYEVEVPVQN